LTIAIQQIIIVVWQLQPFMPEISEKILNHFRSEQITALTPLFPRLEN